MLLSPPISIVVINLISNWDIVDGMKWCINDHQQLDHLVHLVSRTSCYNWPLPILWRLAYLHHWIARSFQLDLGPSLIVFVNFLMLPRFYGTQLVFIVGPSSHFTVLHLLL